MTLIDGKATAETIKLELKLEVQSMRIAGNKIPHLAAVLAGHDGASETYVNNKIKTCKEVGFESTLFRFDDSITESFLLDKINELNENDDIDGFIVQLPLPSQINIQKITEAISPAKDVDGFHPVNIGRMTQQQPSYIPATPKGIMQLLERYKIETAGKHAVVLGRSNIVGTPMSILLSRNNYPGNCTVTTVHSHTKNIKEILLQADIIIAAIGKPGFVKGDMVKEGAVVIDVGITRVESSKTKNGYKLLGDVAFEEVAPKCSYITPVPGGVGPMTIIGLLQNTLLAAKKSIYHDAGSVRFS